MFSKLIDGNLQRAPKFFEIDGKSVFTNSAKIHREHGYKRVVTTSPPQIQGYYPKSTWIDTGSQIIQEWQLIPAEDGDVE